MKQPKFYWIVLVKDSLHDNKRDFNNFSAKNNLKNSVDITNLVKKFHVKLYTFCSNE